MVYLYTAKHGYFLYPRAGKYALRYLCYIFPTAGPIRGGSPSHYFVHSPPIFYVSLYLSLCTRWSLRPQFFLGWIALCVVFDLMCTWQVHALSTPLFYTCLPDLISNTTINERYKPHNQKPSGVLLKSRNMWTSSLGYLNHIWECIDCHLKFFEHGMHFVNF